ncbi:PhaM family polyhydroxyalkanoate granule multifunctional regulatory protein [Acidovorax sp. FG27]|uniref:PhaM family polyhydroxyalkanoate granule multifunctional regulatory protein n=1 Tax=Acidovorax sp. FG27 TaxID=3133652 RepID=UPI0030E7DDC8
MSDSSPFGFGRFVPGFDFLQNLAKNSAASVPAMPGWVAPTVSEEELEKRIEELKAVQFWLDQNSRALTATVQALEVQKMTLATLKGMNVAMGDLASAFTPKAPAPAPEAARAEPPAAPSMSSFFGASRAAAAEPDRADPPAPAPRHAGPDAPADDDANGPEAGGEEAAAGEGAAAADAPAAAPGVIDPMQWWTALGTQFQQIAAHALQDVAQHQSTLDATRTMAAEAVKTATGVATHLAAQGMQGLQDAARQAPAGKPGKSRTTAKAAAQRAAPKRAAAPSSTPRAAGKAPAAKVPAKAPAKAAVKAVAKSAKSARSAKAAQPKAPPRTARSRPAR